MRATTCPFATRVPRSTPSSERRPATFTPRMTCSSAASVPLTTTVRGTFSCVAGTTRTGRGGATALGCAAEVQTQSGHDLIEMRMHFPWLYETQLVDLSSIVADLEKQYGKALSSAGETAKVKGVWRAVPQYHAMFVATYREDLFKKASLKVPVTWEDLYVAGHELKHMGEPL